MSSIHAPAHALTYKQSKPRTIVKPIALRKFESNSLDLDRPAAVEHDGSFSQPARRAYHNRSTSGGSQFSTSTTESSVRVGSFVHPFQQTPRPHSPPLPHNSSVSFRESELNSPTLTEDEDQNWRPQYINLRSQSNLSTQTTSITGAATPAIGSTPLRIQTQQSSSSRLALGTSHTSLSNSLALSPELPSPADVMSPASAIRSSFDKGFRMRSRSEVDTYYRAETIQEARRKFHEKEQAKEEKAAREEIRALEKRNQKEARQIERRHRRSSASERGHMKRAKSDTVVAQEKDSYGRGHAMVDDELPSTIDNLEPPKRNHTLISSTKKSTQSAWTKFVMWFRTRLIRIGKKTPRSTERQIR